MVAVADESNAEYFNVEPVDGYIVKTGGSINYEVPFYYQNSYTEMNINFNAYLFNSNGDKIADGASPSTGKYTDNGVKKIKVTAPKSDGMYRLVVDYEGTIDDEPFKGSSQAAVRVVVPITLNAEVTNIGDVTSSITVSFIVDDNIVEGSETTLDDLAPGSKKTVTYEWVTDSLGEGRHTYKAVTDDDVVLSKGEFYIGHDDYQWATMVIALLFIVLIVALLYIVRKPVKNYGKPKGRR